MPGTPKELLILEAVCNRLRLINGAGDYNLTFSPERIQIWESNWQADEGMAIGVFSGRAVNTSPTDNPNVRRAMWSLPVTIVGFLKTSDDAAITPVTAFQCIADIKTAIRNEGSGPPFLPEQWPDPDKHPLAMFTKDVAHSIEREPDSLQITGVQVEIDIIYLNQKFNSYE